jgi:hypothetical protein
MSNDNTGNARKPRKKVNLATAKTADGEVRTPTSVYEILGISTHGYKTTSLASYSANIKTMNLAQLHEEAYARAVLATDDRATLIERLEKKFIQETSKFKTGTGRTFDEAPAAPETEREQALRTLSRGR